MANVGIMGAGGWALGLAMTLNRNNHKVTVWSKVKAELDAIRETGQNERSFPGFNMKISFVSTLFQHQTKTKNINR